MQVTKGGKTETEILTEEVQIRIKKTTEQLDASIKNFNDSSNKAYNQLNDSIKKFNESSDKYSEELIGLTRAISVFTIIVMILTTYTITKDLVDEKTFALIPFFNSNSLSALVYAGIIDICIFVVLMSFSVSEKFEKLINYFKRK